MNVLGVHLGWWPKTERGGRGFAQHDAAAAFVAGGEVIAAVEDERLNRIKHSNFFPVDAINWVLEAGHATLESVDRVAVNISQAAADTLEVNGFKGPAAIGNLFRRCLGIDVTGKLLFCHHHLAHAASAYYPSGFEHAAVVSLDGDGEGLSGMVLHARDGDFKPITAYPSEISLGNFYSGAIEFLGYRRFDEYRLWGWHPTVTPGAFIPYSKKLTNFFQMEHTGFLLPHFAPPFAGKESWQTLADRESRSSPFTMTSRRRCKRHWSGLCSMS